MKKVYLAGPITGASWGKSEDWRDEVKLLASASTKFDKVQFFSPLRGKEYLKGEVSIADSYEDRPFSTSRAVMLRDSFDVSTSNALIVHLIGASKVSIGTVMEIAWAYEKRIPIIAIMEESGNIHEHSMLNEAVWWRVQTVEDALYALSLLFNP